MGATFCGTIGGPIRRNKAFFFGSYQRLERRSDVVVSSAFPPTAAERQGDFSRTIGAAPVDPLTNQPFPNAQIPASRLDPVALKLMERFPLPNRADGRYVAQRAIATSGDQVNLSAPANFGRITSAGPGRAMQLALKLEF